MFGLSPDSLKLIQIFHPFAVGRVAHAHQENMRFVHYSSAEAALAMLENECVWMRRAIAMSDFKEINYGKENLFKAYQGDLGKRFKAAMDNMHAGISGELENLFNGWIPSFENQTFLTCVSEHSASEDKLGRLSMWRAYGGVNGVAVIMKGGAFIAPSSALKAYTSPVAYLWEEEFLAEFGKVVLNIEEGIDFLRGVDRQLVLSQAFMMFRSALLCTKHPGFHEEREWRVFYSPEFERSDHIREEIVSLSGVPQVIQKIPLVIIQGEQNLDLSIPGLLDRIIIGPTRYPFEIWEAFVKVLSSKGVENAAEKVFVSTIPLRVG